MNEEEFIGSIDCCFPYTDPMKWKKVINTAIGISDNACFMVLHELCRPPRSSKVKYEAKLKIFNYLAKRFKHPLVTLLKRIILSMLKAERVPVGVALSGMKMVSAYRSQYSALAICLFSANCCTNKAEAFYERIVFQWENKA
jgi:hypothetical protein